MARHNKKRNTAFIYEVLVREIIKQTINEDKEKRDIAIGVIKGTFKKGTVLRKELELYKTLMETSGLDERVAEKLIFEVKKEYNRLDQKRIFKDNEEIENYAGIFKYNILCSSIYIVYFNIVVCALM